MPQVLLGLDVTEIADLLGRDLPAYRARQVYEAVYRQGAGRLSEITTLPAAVRRQLEGGAEVGLPRIYRRIESQDGTRRYLLELGDGRTVEAVLMPEQARDTICISTQVGCPVGCKFCMTALMGLERNLSAGEIVGQVLVVARDSGLAAADRRVNVVMMGMGEPLLNLASVVKAARLLADPLGVGLSQRRLTLSTAGITPRLAELGREPARPKLAVSLNASTEEQRREIMPITGKYPLAGLIQACRAYPLRPWERLTFEYVLLRDVNDTDADARRVVRLLDGLKCKVNLIACNPGPGIAFGAPPPGRVASFQAIVRRSLPCFVRKPRGRDIFAACGQLKRMAANGQADGPAAPASPSSSSRAARSSADSE